ncbi:MAG: hypothetical protein JWR80_5147 [Bradyrhizobium sp.]|nr:hypothetical protein [Bradyrhizobium sp.]
MPRRIFVAGALAGVALLISSAGTSREHQTPFPQTTSQQDGQLTKGTLHLAQARGDRGNPQEQATESGGAHQSFACVVNLKALRLEAFMPLREQPDQKARETERVASGTALRVKAETPARDWVNVELLVESSPKNARPRSGWVIARYLQRVTDPAMCKTGTTTDATPSVTPPPASGDFGCVANLATGREEFLSLRQSAAAGSREVERLKRGEALRIRGATKTADWLNVDVGGGPNRKAQTGWVNARFVQRVSDPALCKTEVAAPAPTPTIPPKEQTPPTKEQAPAEVTKAAEKLFNTSGFCKEVLPLFFKSKYSCLPTHRTNWPRHYRSSCSNTTRASRVSRASRFPSMAST